MKKCELAELLLEPPSYGANHKSIPYVEGETYRYLRITDINDEGNLISAKKVGIPKSKGEPYLTFKDDILIARTGATVGKSFFVDRDNIYTHAGYLLKFRLDSRKVYAKYVRQYFHSPIYWSWIKATIRTGAQPNINAQEYSQMVLNLPSLKEQKKIAEILGASDEAIEAQQKLIELKEKRLKGWMQKLLTGKVRFPQFADKPWQEIRAQELFTTRSLKNKEGLPVLSVTQDEGVVLRDDLDRKISGAASNFPNYKVILPGDFVISLRSFQGGLEYSRLKGAVSPAYHVLYKKCELYDEFYRLFFKSWEFVGRLSVATIGIRDGKQISFKDFSFMKVPSPTLQEQEKVASFLCELESELVIEKDKLSQLKLQKKSLMQMLLAGKVRVKVDGVVEDSR